MKRIFALVPCLLLAGCTAPKSSVGWSFQVHKAGELYQPVPYQQSSGNLGIAPVGAIGLDSRVAITGATRLALGEEVEHVPAAQLLRPARAQRVASPLSDCTQEEICEMLRALLRERGLNTKGAKPMPRSEE